MCILDGSRPQRKRGLAGKLALYAYIIAAKLAKFHCAIQRTSMCYGGNLRPRAKFVPITYYKKKQSSSIAKKKKKEEFCRVVGVGRFQKSKWNFKLSWSKNCCFFAIVNAYKLQHISR